MAIPVKLDAFEGPLDLLLHLIEKNKINIYDIPIAEIADQYMQYVQAMETKDLDIVSEFLVMAATLLNIKSKMLLPADESLPEEEQDPRRELVERLLEYKMYRFISWELKDKQVDASRVLFKQASIPEEIKNYREEVNLETLLADLTLAKLHSIFRSVVKKQVDKIDPVRSKFGRIEKEEVSLTEKISRIEELGRRLGAFSFRKFLGREKGKMNMIVAFLAVLELIKIGKITILQDVLFDDIRIIYQTDETAYRLEEYLLTEY